MKSKKYYDPIAPQIDNSHHIAIFSFSRETSLISWEFSDAQILTVFVDNFNHVKGTTVKKNNTIENGRVQFNIL